MGVRVGADVGADDVKRLVGHGGGRGVTEGRVGGTGGIKNDSEGGRSLTVGCNVGRVILGEGVKD